MRAGIFPALHGGLQEARQLVDFGGILECAFQGIETIFKGRDLLVFIFEGDQMICQYSLYVMVEMQSACFCRIGSTLKPCFSTLTPPAEPPVLKPSLAIQFRNGYSLPPNH